MPALLCGHVNRLNRLADERSTVVRRRSDKWRLSDCAEWTCTGLIKIPACRKPVTIIWPPFISFFFLFPCLLSGKEKREQTHSRWNHPVATLSRAKQSRLHQEESSDDRQVQPPPLLLLHGSGTQFRRTAWMEKGKNIIDSGDISNLSA